ncbi:TonB-dependent siderophore receptor [Aquabacterium sp. CECT 9606]|uniref:TonB-dependent siderophore receptor n=1 Tax=Aquabacterium sp. CECT 9606 TaxID=2845822 RepID=UPI001E6392B2|nr:TonB-dependent siderophore receptor [Aquabacterium sp. CECT 9606]
MTGKRDAETATGPVNGYVAKRSASGTKTDSLISETPQSISVVTRNQMKAQGVQTAEQALRYTAGVMTEVTGYDLRYQSMVVRGFAPTVYRDGMRTFASGSFGDWQADPQGLERVEVLKGPASVLYGQGAPGGIVNQVSKRPQVDQINEIGMSVGNHDRYEASFDLGGKFDQDGTLLFRINGLVRDSKTQTDYSQDNRVFLAPSLSWRPSAQTSVTVLADVTRDRATPKSWWPTLALIQSNPKIPVNRFAGEPGFDHYNRDMASLGYLIEHKFNETWTVRQNVRYSDFRLNYQHLYGDSWTNSDMTDIVRGSLLSRTKGRALTVDNQAEVSLNWGIFKQKILLGLDTQRFTGIEDLGFGNAPILNVYNPVYGLAVDPIVTNPNTSKLRQAGLYAQDQMRLGAWAMNVGLRHDRTATFYSDGDVYENKNAKTTYNLGVLRTWDNGISPYASYSTSFEPGNVFDRTVSGEHLKPESGQQIELGVKYQPRGTDLLLTASVFDLKKQNVTTDDPNDTADAVIQTGEVHVKGLELEGSTSLGRQLDLIASYTYLVPKVSRSNNGDVGHQLDQTTRNTAKVWLDYKFSGSVLGGLSIGGGVRYVDKVLAAYDGDVAYYNPSYTVIDAAIHYKTGPITLALNAANLTDKAYVANRAQFYGQGRVLRASLAYNW